MKYLALITLILFCSLAVPKEFSVDFGRLEMLSDRLLVEYQHLAKIAGTNENAIDLIENFSGDRVLLCEQLKEIDINLVYSVQIIFSLRDEISELYQYNTLSYIDSLTKW